LGSVRARIWDFEGGLRCIVVGIWSGECGLTRGSDRWRVACGGGTKIGADVGVGYEVVLAGEA